MTPTLIEVVATVLFALAIAHTFLVKRFDIWSQRYPPNSIGRNTFHLLAEVEVVFGLWATVFLLVMCIGYGPSGAIDYLEGRFTLPGQPTPISVNYTEPLFIFVIMVMAATRPILEFVRGLIEGIARILPFGAAMSFFVTCLVIGPLLGSFITEPAAMTVLALLLKRRFYDRGISNRFKYATLGLLFVNVSIGGTLTHFAAPPVVMVASKWNYDIVYMFSHFGWKAALAILVATFGTALFFRKELKALDDAPASFEASANQVTPPIWLIVAHLVLMAGVVFTSHHIPAFFGIFLLFIGLTAVTKHLQEDLKVREGLLVAYFLMGLVLLGALQTWWLQPLITAMSDLTLYFGTTLLSGITDNAALTFLGSQVQGISDASKYALVAGAVTGGGLTVIANAPNPAGYGILKGSFGSGISPLYLLLSALPATILAALAFLLLPNL